jgi:hypothetical protein
VDPNYLFGRQTIGLVAIERGDADRGVASFEAARRLTNDVESLNSLAGAALAEARAGRVIAARGRLHEAELQARAYSPAPLHTALFMAQAYVALGNADQALAWFARYQPRANLHFQLHLRCDPTFDAISTDRRFRSLLTGVAPVPG